MTAPNNDWRKKKRDRNVRLVFWVSEQEKQLIAQKMAQIGSLNLSAYLRKMAIDGYIVNLDLPELKELISLLRRSSNSLNQIAKRVNTTSRIYQEDLQAILEKQEQLWQMTNALLTKISAIT